MSNLKQIVGKNLKRLRKERKLTQTQLSVIANVQYRTVGYIEQGRYLGRVDTLEKLIKGLSQEQFSELLNVTMQTISQIECGKRFSTAETIDKICDVYNISPDILFAKNPAYFQANQETRELEINNILTMLNGLDIEKLRIIRNLINVVYDDNIHIKYSE